MNIENPFPKQFFLSGIGTDVGKTHVASKIVHDFGYSYWKPIQAGDLSSSDSIKVKASLRAYNEIFPERFQLQTPASPHLAAELDKVNIKLSDFQLPNTQKPLLVEGAGGLMVPINDQDFVIDLIKYLNLPLVLVIRHYLGSINHSLLSIQAIKANGINWAGYVYNGDEHKASETIIEKYAGMPPLARFKWEQ